MFYYINIIFVDDNLHKKVLIFSKNCSIIYFSSNLLCTLKKSRRSCCMLKLYVRKKILPFRFSNVPFIGEWKEDTILHVTDETGMSFQVKKEGDYLIIIGYAIRISCYDFSRITRNSKSNISDLLKASQNVWIISKNFCEAEIISKENNIPWAAISDSNGNNLYVVVSPIFCKDIEVNEFKLNYA